MSTQLFTHQVLDRVAWVTFDSGGMNTISTRAIKELGDLVDELDGTSLKGVILKGNKFGLGSGADIRELMRASRDDLARLIDDGHDVLFRIEESLVPWLAVIDGFALGGILELALACRGIIATAKSTIGFPEIRLNIFPGLGGTQRAPRRCGLVNATDPVNGQAGFTAILTGKNFKAREAEAIRLIDAVIPEGYLTASFALCFLSETLSTLDRTPPPDLAQAESLKSIVLPTIKKATMGRPNPRAPYVALDVMVKGATLPLREAIKIERDAFLEVATSSEGKAGMRFFFAQQSTQKLPKGFLGKPRKIEYVAVDGIDGFMGGAIAWLCLEAGYKVTGHVPLPEFASSVIPKLRAKYAFALKKGTITEEEVERRLATVVVTTKLSEIFNHDLVIEARSENLNVKADFYRRLGEGLRREAIAASNSSSMGPSVIVPFLGERGHPSNYVNLHFFGPAERMPLVEIVVGDETSPDTVATVHEFVRKIGKTPVILKDGSIGFLVNAGLAVYLEEAGKLYIEGTPINAIDAAMHQVFPMGPFEVVDNSGVDVAAGMFDTIKASGNPSSSILITALRDMGRWGKKTSAGFYDYYIDGKQGGVFFGLPNLIGDRGNRVASSEEIVERCLRALYQKARELVHRGIVASEEECDLAFVMGIGFAMHLGGPIFYQDAMTTRRWSE
ncbi:MAG: hypothetical protein A3G60_03635 [Candidatus Ryanbacteria bacterium RIFCSPLOWO2_12_FULL_47_9c]|uniref:Uncharacterized protein n=1 Tax=Candidatus Ryanbacteria bacterium RIFCSPLOWO2_12_FULL_47_9c TaxID=1802131 RepID=A0A1G2H7B8_9BACT|nr:MAG: Fatty acid oxidation complex subunit alpha [Parcubacteria group bacterium GW2011_GWA2_47_10b]OGZ46089.1 MAG: hypothetical protein A2844_00910 [Candidatus Ryanbacteria bacterium RIFCSPHIGHO2_01_FULL_48_80]OGZ49480.1 MAG: hypothetical protein A3C83_02260 [Candidatus Ryanbacteria bacterium RIFCSPHIGHO2_02_FULL_47_25]OGZ53206.1 MAG: hypothetical protein A3A29_02190 [Candidatus Ryanbacteria bacterium RIFCSPLOWO2_01_FULL_47_79]OGZ57838.1 MAG: hypothetical protein A3G60_03635 [Candidatus Ryanb